MKQMKNNGTAKNNSAFVLYIKSEFFQLQNMNILPALHYQLTQNLPSFTYFSYFLVNLLTFI